MSTKFLIQIWVALLAMLGISIVIGELSSATWATALIFFIAAIKAYLVMAYYMGLKFEPRFVGACMACGLAALTILFFILIPDIVYVYGVD